MKYTEIKGEISAELSRWTAIERTVSDLQLSLSDYKNQLQNYSDLKSKKIKEIRDREFLKFQQEVAKPYQDSIKELEMKKKLLTSKRDEVLKSLNEDDYRKKYRSKVNLEEESELCEDLKQKTTMFYGDELQNALQYLVEDRIESKDDLKNVIPMLNSLTEKVSDVSLDSIIDKMFESFEYKEGDNDKVFATVGISIIIIFILFYFYPLILIAFAILSVYNLVKSHFYIKCISFIKAFENHSSDIKQVINNYVKEKIEDDTAKVNSQFNNSMSKLEKLILEVEQECEAELELTKDAFVFNPVDVDKEFEEKRVSLQNMYDMVQQNLDTEMNKSDDSKKSISSLNLQLKECLKNLYTDYYPNPPKMSNELSSDFLLDINDDQPVFFEYSNECSLFFYEDEEYLNSFMSIIFNQTVLRTSPSQVGFIYYDTKYLGELFTAYQKMPCMQIFNNVKDVKDNINACIEEVNFRREVMSPFGGIDGYNKYLIEQKCIPETVYYLFNCYPDLQSFSDEAQMQLILNGAKYGYRQLIFINSSELTSENKKCFESLLENVGKIYCITENAVKKRSRVFYQTKLEEMK